MVMMAAMVRSHARESSGAPPHLPGAEYGHVIGRWINGGQQPDKIRNLFLMPSCERCRVSSSALSNPTTVTSRPDFRKFHPRASVAYSGDILQSAMGGKRSYDEVDGDAAGRPSKANDDGFAGKRRKPNGKVKGKAKAKEGSNVWAKKRIRAIERLLQRDQGMPQDARNGLERELNGLKSNVADNSFHKTRSAMISKYHMVRFFGEYTHSPAMKGSRTDKMTLAERKKAMRLSKQLRRKIEKCESDEEKKQLERDLHITEVDEAYAQYYPLAEPYISIYPNTKAQESDETEDGKAAIAQAALRAERPPMWQEVEKAMTQGPRALADLRERRPQHDSKPPPRKASAASSKASNTKDQTGLEAFKSRPQANAAVSAAPTTKANGQPLNRRERRKLMHKGIPVVQQSDGEEDDDEGGFLEL